MGTKAGIGMSHHRNPRVAGREAAEKALGQAGIEKPDFVFMFATVGYNQPALVKAVHEATGGVPLCGCSGEGTIAGYEAAESPFSVTVMTISSDEFHFSKGVTTGLQADPNGVGRTIAEVVQPELSSDTVGLFVFPDGITVNFDRFVNGLEESLHPDRFLPLWGGTSAENFQWEKTYQYYNDQVISDGVAWALLSGQVQVAWAVNHGCTPIGVERKITRAEGNIIYEIDGKPALEVLKEYVPPEEMDDLIKVVLAFSLGFKAPGYMQDHNEYTIRAMVGGKDDQAGSVTIPTEVTEGTSVWITRRDHELISQGVDRIAEEIKGQLGDNPAKLVFHFDCAGRGKMMLRDPQKLGLLKTLRQKVGPDVPWLGFYSYAEIGPMKEHNCLHNYTAVVTAIY